MSQRHSPGVLVILACAVTASMAAAGQQPARTAQTAAATWFGWRLVDRGAPLPTGVDVLDFDQLTAEAGGDSANRAGASREAAQTARPRSCVERRLLSRLDGAREPLVAGDGRSHQGVHACVQQ